MKVLYYDCFCGISGDMNLGALADLGVDAGELNRQLSGLKLGGEFELRFQKGQKNGISGTRAEVILKDENLKSGGHHHRNFNDIRAILARSELDGEVKKRSLSLFRRVAAAEGKVHGKPPEEVHFHEVGAVDSIVDLVGAAVALNLLHADRILSSPVQLGGGSVVCAHGRLPVPAPATAELLRGVPVRTGLVPFETTTPTGAAILTEYVDEFTDRAEFTIRKTGCGFGSRDLEIPNILRVFLAEAGEREQTEEQLLLETNIDDMNPEWYGYAEEKLFEAGAADVYKTPIIMKKGRPAVKLSVLTDRAHEGGVADVLFRETTTLGLRRIRVEKTMLRREIFPVETAFGTVRVKQSSFAGAPVKYKAEYEDLRRAAERSGRPISSVARAVDRAMAARNGKTGAGQPEGESNGSTGKI